jgi:hypothetical protein
VQTAGDRLAEAALVIRIGEAVQEAHCHGLDLLRGERLDRARHAGLIEREENLALRINPLAHRQAQPPGDQRRRQVDIDVVLLEPIFVPDLEHIAEPFGGEKGSSGALALDQRIGGERRPMHDQPDLAGLDSRLGCDRAQSSEHARFRRLRGGEDLYRESPLGRFQRDIGERAADVDADPDCGRRCHA